MRKSDARLPTQYGNFDICVWQTDFGEVTGLCSKKINPEEPVLVRIHSECLTGDVFQSQRCDCGEQLQNALRQISDSGNGILIYLRQEGRGIGLFEKIKAYKLQEEGLDTFEANERLGHQADARQYEGAVCVLRELGVQKVRLMTENPEKLKQLKDAGFNVEHIHIESTQNEHNEAYLKAKKERFSKGR